MVLYNLLRNIARRLAMLRGYVNGSYLVLREIFLLKSTVAPLLYNVQYEMGYIVGFAYDIADAYWDFRNEVQDAVQSNPDLKQIIYYADVLIAIARDPSWIIRQGMIKYFPDLVDLARNARAYIINTIQSQTGLSGEILFNPLRYITRLIDDALGDLKNMVRDPRGYIINKITEALPDIRLFFTNPRSYLINEIKSLFPEIAALVRDPDGYIAEKAIAGFEKLVNRYWQRLAKIAERVLDLIF